MKHDSFFYFSDHYGSNKSSGDAKGNTLKPEQALNTVNAGMILHKIQQYVMYTSKNTARLTETGSRKWLCTDCDGTSAELTERCAAAATVDSAAPRMSDQMPLQNRSSTGKHI